MKPQPRQQPVERLEKRLARVAREQGIDQERLRRWVSFLALCGVLEQALGEGLFGSYYLKGGVALELRFAGRARATRDLDLGLEGTRAQRLELLRQALALGFDEFTFRIKGTMREMEQVDTTRLDVAVMHRTRSWQTIDIDLGPAKVGDIEFVEPRVAGLAELGLPVTSPVRCLSLAEQVAQKLHACTAPLPHSSSRARDVLDILLIESLGRLDYERAASAARRVFAERATHAFPPPFSMPPEWRPEVEAMARQLGFASASAREIESRFAEVIRRFAAAEGAP